MSIKTKIKVTTEAEIILPSVPNFIRTANKDVTIPIGEIPTDQLEQIGKAWTVALIAKASERRKADTRKLNKQMKALLQDELEKDES